jgi:hypothetical protein
LRDFIFYKELEDDCPFLILLNHAFALCDSTSKTSPYESISNGECGHETQQVESLCTLVETGDGHWA